MYTPNGLLDDELHTYLIESTAIASMIANQPNAGDGYFSSKANLKEQFEDLSTITIEGNTTLQMWMFDNNNDGSSPVNISTLGIQLNRKAGGIWFSSNWSGTATIKQAIVDNTNCDGELKVSPNNKDASVVIDDPETTLSASPLTVYPNPTNDKTTFKFVPGVDSRAKLEVYSVNGVLVETLYDQNVIGGTLYEIEYRPALRNSAMMLYRLILDDKVYTGKIMFQR